MVVACGARVSMAWARLVRTLARSAAICGVTDPLVTQLCPRPMPTPRTRASWNSRQALKSMSSAPSCRRTKRAGCCTRSVAAISSARFAGLLGRDEALPVAGGVVGTVGHRTAYGELVAGQVAVGAPHGHRQPEVIGHQAGIGLGRGALGDRSWRGARSGASDRDWRARARRGPSRRGRRRGSRPSGRGSAPAGCCGWPPRRPRHQRNDDHGGHDLEHAGVARRVAPGLQPSHPRTSRVAALHRRQRRCDLTGWVQPGGSSTRQPLWPPKPKEFDSTAAGSQGRGSPCTIRMEISGSGSP